MKVAVTCHLAIKILAFSGGIEEKDTHMGHTASDLALEGSSADGYLDADLLPEAGVSCSAERVDLLLASLAVWCKRMHMVILDASSWRRLWATPRQPNVLMHTKAQGP